MFLIGFKLFTVGHVQKYDLIAKEPEKSFQYSDSQSEHQSWLWSIRRRVNLPQANKAQHYTQSSCPHQDGHGFQLQRSTHRLWALCSTSDAKEYWDCGDWVVIFAAWRLAVGVGVLGRDGRVWWGWTTWGNFGLFVYEEHIEMFILIFIKRVLLLWVLVIDFRDLCNFLFL